MDPVVVGAPKVSKWRMRKRQPRRSAGTTPGGKYAGSKSSRWRRQRAARQNKSAGSAGGLSEVDLRERELGHTCELLVHEATEFGDSVVINPTHFPYIRAGDIVHIVEADSRSNTKRGTRRFTGRAVVGDRAVPRSAAASEAGSATGKGVDTDAATAATLTTTGLLRTVRDVQPVSGTWAISLLRSIADEFGLRRQTVVVRVVKPELVELDFVQVAFRDQFMSRSGLWRFKQEAAGLCTHRGEFITRGGVRLQFQTLRRQGAVVRSGLVSERTKFICRSRSARITILVQLSREMWEFAEDGQLHFERVVDRFFKVLFDKWTALGATHNLTVIFFTRTYYDDLGLAAAGTSAGAGVGAGNGSGASNRATPGGAAGRALCADWRGRMYEDMYQVVVEGVCSDWNKLLVPIRQAFLRFPVAANWGMSATGYGSPSSAAAGNFLEAINLSLNEFELHFIDRLLQHMGQHIVVVSAGNAVFEVDPRLTLLTTRRMLDNGIGCDLICVVPPPLHMVPLFMYTDQRASTSAGRRREVYSMPRWLHTSFFGPGKARLQPPYIPWSENPEDIFTTFVPPSKAKGMARFKGLRYAHMVGGGSVRLSPHGDALPLPLLQCMVSCGLLQYRSVAPALAARLGLLPPAVGSSMSDQQGQQRDAGDGSVESRTPPSHLGFRRTMSGSLPPRRPRAFSLGSAGSDDLQLEMKRAMAAAAAAAAPVASGPGFGSGLAVDTLAHGASASSAALFRRRNSTGSAVRAPVVQQGIQRIPSNSSFDPWNSTARMGRANPRRLSMLGANTSAASLRSIGSASSGGGSRMTTQSPLLQPGGLPVTRENSQLTVSSEGSAYDSFGGRSGIGLGGGFGGLGTMTGRSIQHSRLPSDGAFDLAYLATRPSDSALSHTHTHTSGSASNASQESIDEAVAPIAQHHDFEAYDKRVFQRARVGVGEEPMAAIVTTSQHSVTDVFGRTTPHAPSLVGALHWQDTGGGASAQDSTDRRQMQGLGRMRQSVSTPSLASMAGMPARASIRRSPMVSATPQTAMLSTMRLPGASTGAKPGGLSMSLTSRGLRMRGTSRARVGGAMGALGLNNSTAGGSAGGGPSLLGFIAEPSSAVPKIAEEETPPSADVADASGEGTPNEAEEAPPSTTARIVGRARSATEGNEGPNLRRTRSLESGALQPSPAEPPTLSRVHTGPTPADLLSKSYENRLSRSYEKGSYLLHHGIRNRAMEYMPVIPSPNREAQASAAITSGGADTATVSSQSGSTVAATDAVATTRSWQPPSVRTHGTRVEDEGSAGRAKSSAVAILRGQQRHAALARSRGIAAGLALNASPPRTSSPAWATRAASTLGAGLGPMLVPPSSPPFVPTAAAAALRGKQLSTGKVFSSPSSRRGRTGHNALLQTSAALSLENTLNPFQPLEHQMEKLTVGQWRWAHIFPSSRAKTILPPATTPAHGVATGSQGVSVDAKAMLTSPNIGHGAGTGSGSAVAKAQLKGGAASSQSVEQPSFRALGQRITKSHWRSLCEPAMMPLTTNFFPTPLELSNLFSVTMYDVLLPLPGELAALGYSNHEELIKEMVSQRLAQNYQLVLFDDKATKPIERTAVAANAKPLYSLIVGRRIHHLLYGENKITVKQYIRQPGEESAASYRYMLYSSLEQRARPVYQKFFNSPHDEYRWNYLDQVVCASTDGDTYINDLEYKRVLFLLTPMCEEASTPTAPTNDADAALHAGGHGNGVPTRKQSSAELGGTGDAPRSSPPPVGGAGTSAGVGAGAGAGAGAGDGATSSASHNPEDTGSACGAWWDVPAVSDRAVSAASSAYLKLLQYLQAKTDNVVVCGIRTCDGVRYAHKGSEDLHVLPSNGPAPLHQHGSTVKVRLSMSSSDAVHWLLVQHGAVLNPFHSFAVEIRFLLALGRSVDEWVRTLRQKAKQAGMLMRQVMEVSRSSVVCEAAPPGVQMSLPVTTGLAHPNAPAQTPVAGPVRGLNTSATALTPALRPPFLCVTPLAISHAAMKAMLKRTWCASSRHSSGEWHFGASMTAFEAALVSRFGFVGDVAFPGLQPRQRAAAAAAAGAHSVVAGAGRTSGQPASAPENGMVAASSSMVQEVEVPTTLGVKQEDLSAPPCRLLSPTQTTVLHAGWFLQYVHNTAACFLRINANGVFWIPNRLPGHVRPTDQETPCDVTVRALFTRVAKFCEAYAASTETVVGVISQALWQREDLPAHSQDAVVDASALHVASQVDPHAAHAVHDSAAAGRAADQPEAKASSPEARATARRQAAFDSTMAETPPPSEQAAVMPPPSTTRSQRGASSSPSRLAGRGQDEAAPA